MTERMTATREALDRLKATASAYQDAISLPDVDRALDAADAALAEVERWEQERAELTEAYKTTGRSYLRERAAREEAERERDEALAAAAIRMPYDAFRAAEAENQRLREALEAIANPDGLVSVGDPAGIRIPPYEFARATLATSPDLGRDEEGGNFTREARDE